MKYIFFGTPEFAAIILENLIRAKIAPVLVVCNPDRPRGRKKIITPPPVKAIAMKSGIPVWQPEKLKVTECELMINNADFAVVAAYSKIIPRAVINLFPLGVVGVHPSLLPKYRGPTPIQSAILAGETKTGASLFLMDEEIDHGPIIAYSETAVSSSDTYETLHQKLADLSAEILITTLPEFIRGKIQVQPQNHNQATLTRKFTGQDGFIDLTREDPETIWRKIKALNPEPGAFTYYNKKRVKLLEAELNNIQVTIKKIQVEGKKPRVTTEHERKELFKSSA